ncbi:HlyD family secretion protein [Mucilaginibacter pineti]|uniref:HlyD family secretion protein n=1 Tax=Mucilaginibacter pineti TaxID=1391627 RepID=A0A1G7FDP3_9SPHI|nr:HlyD family secretion protein [Mucilaginibacter pineti]
MPATNSEPRHTEDIQDIITAVPSWILRWGTTLFSIVLLLLIAFSAIIRYPDIITVQLQIVSPNSAKPIVSKTTGKLIKLLVGDDKNVKSGQSLAFMESTAKHTAVLDLIEGLKRIQYQVLRDEAFDSRVFNRDENLELGEIQSAYQLFFEEYQNYISTINSGFLLKRKLYLQNDLANLVQMKHKLTVEKGFKERDLNLAAEEFEMHKKLENSRVETQAEFRQEESKYLAKKTPLLEIESAIISSSDNYTSKQKEILELENEIQNSKGRFLQALNSFISVAEDWKSKYILTASQSGKLSYIGIVQENQVIATGQEVFFVNPGDEQFFGKISIPQNSIGKVDEGQSVLIKMKGFPFEEFGFLRGKIKYISNVPYRDSVFIAKVDLSLNNTTDLKKSIHLKQGMTADAEIITQSATILERIGRNIFNNTR